MPVTPENSVLNARTAARNVVARLGIPAQRSERTFDQQVAYVHALAAEILRYPQSFTPETVAYAREVQTKDYGSITDPSFSFGDFTDAVAAEASVTLPAVGNKLLVAVVVLGVAWIYFNRRPSAA